MNNLFCFSLIFLAFVTVITGLPDMTGKEVRATMRGAYNVQVDIPDYESETIRITEFHTELQKYKNRYTSRDGGFVRDGPTGSQDKVVIYTFSDEKDADL